MCVCVCVCHIKKMITKTIPWIFGELLNQETENPLTYQTCKLNLAQPINSQTRSSKWKQYLYAVRLHDSEMNQENEISRNGWKLRHCPYTLQSLQDRLNANIAQREPNKCNMGQTGM